MSQICSAAVTLAVNPTTVDLPAVNAGSTSSVSDKSASLTATGSGSSSFSTSIAYGTPPVAYKSTQNWLTVTTSSSSITAGGAAVSITLKGNPTGLQAGPYSATVTFTAGSSTAKLTVTFAPQGVDLTAGLKAPLASLRAGLKQQVGEIDVALTNANGSATTQSIQVTTQTDGGNWLLTSADSPLTVTGPGIINVTVDAASLTAGSTHSATMTIGCVNGAPCLPKPIQVSVQVTAPPPPPPTLSSISPSSAQLGATVAVTLTGTNLSGTTVINAGPGISVTGINPVSNTQVAANFTIFPNAFTGDQSVIVTTPGGISNSVTFTIAQASAPVLTSIAPNSGAPGSTVAVTMSGTNLSGLTSINAGSGITVNAVNVVGATQVTANFVIAAAAAAGGRSVTLITGGGTSNAVSFTVSGGSGGSVTAVVPHIAAGNSFVTGFSVVNSGSAAANFSIAFRDDNGNAVAVPVGGLGVIATLSDTLPPNGSRYYEAGDPNAANGFTGSGVVTADPSITIQAIFRRLTSNIYYEAAVPSSTGSNEVEIPFDATVFPGNGAQIYTGFAIANADGSNSANINCSARDTQGIVIPNAVSVPVLQPYGHWASASFPQLLGRRGTIDCTSNTKIASVALRALGSDAISSLPVVSVGAASTGGTSRNWILPHVATGGSFVTGFYVVNSGSSSASFSVSFHGDNGNSVLLPFGSLGSLTTLSDTIPANGSRYYEAGDANDPNTVNASGLVTADASITIQAIFRRLTSHVYYEAAVPASSGSNEFIIPFDATTFPANGSQIYTGFAIANMDGATTAFVTCTARDSQSAVIPNAVTVPNLPPNGHWASASFPQLLGHRGTIDCTSNTKLGPVALRALGIDAISSLPVIVIR